MTDAMKDMCTHESQVEPRTVVVETGEGDFEQSLFDGRHHLIADEPVDAGGNDRGPGPYELMLMALGACTSMTVRMYARRRKWPLERVRVRLRHSKTYIDDCRDCETKPAMLDRIDREIELAGPLDAEQKAKIMEIADKCPLHRSLASGIRIVSTLASQAAGTTGSGAAVYPER